MYCYDRALGEDQLFLLGTQESICFRQLCQPGCCCKKRSQPRNLIVPRCRCHQSGGRRQEPAVRRQELSVWVWVTLSHSRYIWWKGREHSLHLFNQDDAHLKDVCFHRPDTVWRRMTGEIHRQWHCTSFWLWSPSLLTSALVTDHWDNKQPSQ